MSIILEKSVDKTKNINLSRASITKYFRSITPIMQCVHSYDTAEII
jgi:hypothetical protein